MKSAVLTLLCAITFAQGHEILVGDRTLCTCNPNDRYEICARTNLVNIEIAHERCDKFYKCANSVPVPYCCGANLVFNIEKGVCDWPGNVNCGNRTLVAEEDNDCLNNNSNGDNDSNEDNEDNETGPCNCDPSEAPAICSAPGSEGVFVAHEYCNHYYVCNHGRPIAMKCAPRTLYNPYKKKCDWASEVDCGNRPIPEDNGSDNGNGNDNGSGDNGIPETCNCDPAEAPAICSAPNSEGTFVAHENCTHFYICNHGRPVSMFCGTNLLYNPYTRQCDFAKNVDCGDRYDPFCGNCDNSSENNESNGSNGDNGASGGAAGGNSEEDCDSNSGGGSGDSGSGAAGGDGGDSGSGGSGGDGGDSGSGGAGGDGGSGGAGGDGGDSGSGGGSGDNGSGGAGGGGDSGSGGNGGDGGEDCDNGDNAGGGNECNCDPSEAANICSAPDSGGALVAHENCNQFYQCANGVPVAFTCPGILLYNPYIQACDWPKEVDCGDRVIPDGGKDDSEEGEGDDNNNNNEPGDGPDDSGPGSGQCNCDPSEAPSICAGGESDGVLVAHENCNQFYKCANGVPVAMICPPDLLYNPYTKQCDYESKVECGDRVIPENNGEGDNNNVPEDSAESSESNEGNNCGHGNPGLAPEICAAPDSNGVLVAHEHCDKFYMCSNGIPITLTCPPDLSFDPATGICDWEVDCGDRIVPESNGNGNGCICNYREAPTICSQPNSDGIHVAHENCNQFYVCSHGKTVAHSCAPTLFYNPQNKICDWPAFVDCGERTITKFSSFNKHLIPRHRKQVL